MTCRQAAEEVARDEHNHQVLLSWKARAEKAESILTKVFRGGCRECLMRIGGECILRPYPLRDVVMDSRRPDCPYLTLEKK